MKKVLTILFAAVLALGALSSCGKKDSNDKAVNINEPYTDVYDDKGNIEKKVYYNDDGSTNSEYNYEHDEYGNIIKETKTLPDKTIDFISTYEYKKFGDEFKEVKRTVYANEKDVEFYQSDYQYEKYDDQGAGKYRLTSYVTYEADGTEKSKMVYTYSEDGTVKAITTYDPKGNELSKNEF